MGFKTMFLCGHSMGGYIATKYAQKYPERVRSLVLVSPAGIWPKPADFNTKLEDKLKTIGFIRRSIVKRVISSWTPGKSPLELLRNFGTFTMLLLRVYVKFYRDLEKKERHDLNHYLFHILMRRGTGEFAMPYLLHLVLSF